jgi:hypothetical protein
MLYNASGLTSVTPKQSMFRQGGLIYSQFYNSIKEVYDAARYFPFGKDALQELALDLQIRKGAHNAGRGSYKDTKVLISAYCESKRRVREAILASTNKSFGTREEHRINWTIFRRLLTRLSSEAYNKPGPGVMNDHTFIWCIKTDIYLSYL